MPCNNGGPWGRDERDYTNLQKRANRAARAACEMARIIKHHDDAMPRDHKGITWFSRLSPKTQRWIKRHEKVDERRIAIEKAEKKKAVLRAAALSKLTKEERKALGI